MTVTAIMPARPLNLVVPLAHEATAKRTTETGDGSHARSGAVSGLIGTCLRSGDVDSTTRRRTRATTPGSRTSVTATRTTTTRTTTTTREPSADPTTEYAFEALVAAYMECRRSKRNSPSALHFEEHLEHNLCRLHEELLAGTYAPGRSICFVVTHPKPREVWAADFRDRVVHHLLYRHIAPRFHARFSSASCACIPGRGTLYAAQRLEADVRSATRNWSRPVSYLKCDLANFFVAIDKHILFAQLAAHVHEPWWLQLTHTILFHDPRRDVDVRCPAHLMRLVPPHKSLFLAPADTGLPIGNLSSQFFANVHLDALDQFVKHRLRSRYYVRYVDDFVLLHESPQWLGDARAAVSEFLQVELGARLNPRKTILQPVDRGIDFVGHVLKPWCRTLRRGTVRQALCRLETAADGDFMERANSYFGLLRQASCSHTDRAALARAVLRRGHCVNQPLTQTYRKAHP